jgi:hypothetical protein
MRLEREADIVNDTWRDKRSGAIMNKEIGIVIRQGSQGLYGIP